jgi:hypothetical protein
MLSKPATEYLLHYSKQGIYKWHSGLCFGPQEKNTTNPWRFESTSQCQKPDTINDATAILVA